MTVTSSVLLRLPGDPTYVGIARLAMSGLAHQLGVPFDEAQDLKLAVSEACGHLLRSAVSQSDLEVFAEAEPERLAIRVRLLPGLCSTPPREHPTLPDLTPLQLWDEAHLRVQLVGAVMDSVSLEREPVTGAPVMRMTRGLRRRVSSEG